MNVLDSQLLDFWKRDFKREYGFELYFGEEERLILPCLSFDVSFKALPSCVCLQERTRLMGQQSLFFYIYGESYLYCQGQKLRAWEIFRLCVFPFFGKRYGLCSHNFLMDSQGKKRCEKTLNVPVCYCEFQLLQPFILQAEL